MATVTISQVRKVFGSTEVIHGVDIDIADGEFCVLVGPSGCGKSTLLRMIAGLEEITSGTISIGKRVVNNVPPKERDIAMVFQNYALYPHMKVRDNMAFALTLARTPKSEITRRVGEAAQILGLEPYLDRFPRQLSGGQRQRVAMGRAIVRKPQVFLFDEPLSNLDAKLRVAMRTEIKALHQRLKTTAVYVTHDQIEAMTMADRIVVMRDGYVEQIGQPLDLYDRPNNTFVAGFIGSPGMNMVKGVVRSGGLDVGDGVHVDLGRMEAPAGVLQEGREVIFGIRPEHILVGDGSNGMRGKVVVMEPTGADTQVLCRVGNSDIVVVSHDRIDTRAGDEIPLQPDLSQAHVFDAETGRSLRH
ncbi:MAG: sn-glycerol-3-phosphate ABC transporter ATP-binding protein UgpC [Burkholderiaceae bacterium]|nr:sn-glycerol-3-phosphate ABC transporter ATP-binding protein UgpC [Burkholderiaceae bacterium]